MILEVGKLGITQIKNTNTSAPRMALLLYKEMPITGIISLNNKIIDLGYNETIVMESEEKALALFKIINAIVVCGVEADDAITSAINTIENVFFQ